MEQEVLLLFPGGLIPILPFSPTLRAMGWLWALANSGKFLGKIWAWTQNQTAPKRLFSRAVTHLNSCVWAQPVYLHMAWKALERALGKNPWAGTDVCGVTHSCWIPQQMLLEPEHGKSLVLLVFVLFSFFILNFGRQDVNSKQKNLAYYRDQKTGDSAKKCHLSELMIQELYEGRGIFESVLAPQRTEIKIYPSREVSAVTLFLEQVQTHK